MFFSRIRKERQVKNPIKKERKTTQEKENKIADLRQAVFGLKELQKMVQENRYNFNIPIMSIFDVERLKLATILLEEYLHECKESKVD